MDINRHYYGKYRSYRRKYSDALYACVRFRWLDSIDDGDRTTNRECFGGGDAGNVSGFHPNNHEYDHYPNINKHGTDDKQGGMLFEWILFSPTLESVIDFLHRSIRITL